MLPSFPVDQEEKINEVLAKLEKPRKDNLFLARVILIVFIAGATMILFFLFQGKLIDAEHTIPALIISCFLIFIGVIAFLEIKKSFAKKFKRTFFDEILGKILPEVKYLQKKNLATYLVKEGGLFEDKGWFVKSIDKITSDDQFYGTRGFTRFSFSELHLKTSNDDSYITFFKGIFFKCSLNFEVNQIKIYGKGASHKVRKLKEHNLVEGSLKNRENFNKNFSLLIENKEDIVHFKNNNFIESLEDISRIFGPEIYISFKGGFAYFAIGTNKDYFDPDVSKKLDMNQIKSIYHDIINCLMIVDIIDELNHGAPNPNLKQIDEY